MLIFAPQHRTPCTATPKP